jgi:hypothetical protein
MSKSLQLITQASDIVNKLVESGGEITPELEEIINGLSLDTERYADRVKYVIDELDSYADKLSSKIKVLQSAKKALDNNRDNLSERLKYVLANKELTEVIGSDYVAKVSSSQPKLVIDDNLLVPESYKIITFEIDKDAIKDALKKGLDVPGCRLEQSKTLRWSVNKGK